MVATDTATRGLSTSDLEHIRDSLAGGRKPKVVFTESAGQMSGQVGQVVALTDPQLSEEWVVVRFGRDELPFSPPTSRSPRRPRRCGAPSRRPRSRARSSRSPRRRARRCPHHARPRPLPRRPLPRVHCGRPGREGQQRGRGHEGSEGHQRPGGGPAGQARSAAQGRQPKAVPA